MTLYLLRKKQHLTAEDMAKKLNISRGHYSHLEGGTRDFTEDLLNKAANILNERPEVIAKMAAEMKSKNAVPNSWIFKIKIDGMPLIKSFQEFFKMHHGKGKITEEDLETMVAKFITYRIEHSVRDEFKNNSDIAKYILTGING